MNTTEGYRAERANLAISLFNGLHHKQPNSTVLALTAQGNGKVLNLITESWIPSIRNGERQIIRPDQIAEPDITALDWPRADFNLACLEFLIGLVSLTDAPKDEADWISRYQHPDPERLRRVLMPFAPHFELAGDGPRFLQDREAFEQMAQKTDLKSVDMLFIDSAGKQTMSRNADLIVKRDRFSSLSPSEAAMALYTLQAFAPSGGAGNRVSMRGGGPMTTLVRPIEENGAPFCLWRWIFSNVLIGTVLEAHEASKALPWLNETRKDPVTPEQAHPLEAFFGMPRRLRLIFDQSRVVNVVQKPYGTKYSAWQHPLTPYFRKDTKDPEWLPVHPKAGRLSYINWLGITIETDQNGEGTRRTAQVIRKHRNHLNPPDSEIVVGGWAMDNMKPLDFSLDEYPYFSNLKTEIEDQVYKLVEAANAGASTLRKALKTACDLQGKFADAIIESYFNETEEQFKNTMRNIIDSEDAETIEMESWYLTLKNQAWRLFNHYALSGLSEQKINKIETRVAACRKLISDLTRQIRKKLELPQLNKKRKS